MPWQCPLCDMKLNEDAKIRTRKTDANILALQNKMKTNEERMTKYEIQMSSQASQIDTILQLVTNNTDVQENRLSQLDSKIEACNDRLSKEMCFIQGQHKADELIISGIPPVQNENLRNYVVNIGNALNVRIAINEIRKIHRLTGPTDATGLQPNRFPPIMVKFTTQTTRDTLNDNYIHNLKNKIFLTLASANIAQNQTRIYINPHLPQCLKDVYKKALQLKKEGRIGALHAKINAVSIKVDEVWHKVQTDKELEDVINKAPLVPLVHIM